MKDMSNIYSTHTGGIHSCYATHASLRMIVRNFCFAILSESANSHYSNPITMTENRIIEIVEFPLVIIITYFAIHNEFISLRFGARICCSLANL